MNSRVSFYADDTKLYGNANFDYGFLQEDLDSVLRWSIDWVLPLNTNKCVVLHLGKNNPCYQYNLNNTPLQTVSSYNDLGVIITKDLSWSEHIASVCKRANTMLYLLKATFSKMSFPMSIRLYKCYVRPLLEFAGPVWNATLIRDQNLLDSVQRRATRLAFGRTRPPYSERLISADLTCFSDRKLRGDLITTFRVINNLFGSDLSMLFNLNYDERLRGHELKLKKEVFKTRVRQTFLSNRVFSTWNSLPPSVICAPSVNVFKNRFDAWYSNRTT